VTPLPDRDPLDQKLSALIGGKTAAALSKGLGLETVGDLLTHYPRRYARLGELTALAELELDTQVTIVAEVLSVEERPMKAKKGSIVEVRITDGTGILVLTFFNQSFREREFRPGRRGMFSGKISDYKGKRQLTHPTHKFFDKDSAEDADVTIVTKEVLKPIPIYPATAAMPTWAIADAVKVVLEHLPNLEDPVPRGIREEMGVIAYNEAIRGIHQPTKDADHLRARDALTFQEAFVLQTTLLKNKKEFEKSPATPRRPGPIARGFDESMPFTLTGDQRLVGGEIARDMESTAPMNRLLQGEVGSGKTLVALRAMLAVADSGGQAALLAPTEVLAAQHLRSIVKTLGPDLAAKLRPTLLTGQLSTAERRKALLAIVSGGARIVIGTHALLGDAVSFYDLGLVVVDEQHRFGVEQREALRQKGSTSPHVLVLTATPIPRTVAMTVFGDLEISTISELPSGRTPIKSFVVPYKSALFGRVWGRMSEEIARGHQAFVVCPAIDANVAEPADRLEGEPAPDLAEKPAGRALKSATGKAAAPTLPLDPVVPAAPMMNVVDTVERLRERSELATARIASLHGRMSSEEKDTVMRAFSAGDIDVLVATTVIEVGVDVPNASIMVVLDADRFGVSQLHQLRGRVGRGGVESLAFFATSAPEESLGRERVEAVASTLDGFELARTDLVLRREGDVLGAMQSGGRSSLRLLRVVQHEDLIGQARDFARRIVDEDPELEGHPALKRALARRLDETEAAFLAKN
jgi:ATP-dependent DNA helicase RecG